MKWRKLGHVYKPDGSKPWMRTHAANPIPEHIAGDRFRVYFSARDDANRSYISSIDIDLNEPSRVLAEADTPVLAPGDLAMFDDCGCSIGCIVPVGDARLLYYMGWHLTVSVPWQNALGLAISPAPGEPFTRVSRFPVVPLDEVDPYTISYPWVLVENGVYRMWYGSNIQWGSRVEDMRHLIKYAESRDGRTWERHNVVVIDFATSAEYAMCKPCVLKGANGYEMWFCSRGNRYRICYARSDDGLAWERLDDRVGITVSADGWDSDMIEYPSVFDHQGERFMLYAGNRYGAEGFGLAIEERR